MAALSRRSLLTLASASTRANAKFLKKLLPALNSFYEVSTTSFKPACIASDCSKSRILVPYRIQRLASTTAQPSTAEADFGELKIYKLREADIDEAFEFLKIDFVYTEPHNSAINLTIDDARPIFRALLRAGIASGTTYGLRNERNELVALRLSSILDRPVPGKTEGSAVLFEGITERAKRICDMVDVLEAKIWTTLGPEIKRLFYLLIISVRKDYARRGLAYKLMHYKVDEAKKMGCQGWVSEGTAYNSQKMFEKMGFTTLYELKDEDYLDKNGKRIFYCEPPTNSSKLVFKPF